MNTIYRIRSVGYSGGEPRFTTMTAARKYLADIKREDKAVCKKRYGTVKVTNWKTGFKIEFGCNLFSSSNIEQVV